MRSATIMYLVIGVLLVCAILAQSTTSSHSVTAPDLQEEPFDPLLRQDLSLSYARRADSTVTALESALSTALKSIPRDDSLVSSLLFSLGMCRKEREEWIVAESLLTRCVSMRKSSSRHGDIKLAEAQIELGRLLLHLWRRHEAERYLRSALTIMEERFGPDDPHVADVLDDLAAVHYSQLRFLESDAELRRSLTIKTNLYSADHPWTAHSAIQLADNCRRLQRTDEAETLFATALPVLERTIGFDHPEVAWAYERLSWHRGVQKRMDEKVELLHRALAIRERHQPPHSLHIARTLRDIADHLCLGSNSLAEATLMADRAEAIYERSPDFMGRTMIQMIRGWIHRAKGERSDAFQCAVRAYDIYVRWHLRGARYLTEEDMLGYISGPRWTHLWALTYFAEMTAPTARDSLRTAEIILGCKGMTMDILRRRREALQEGVSPAALAIADSIAALDIELSGVFVRGNMRDTASADAHRLSELQVERDKLEIRWTEVQPETDAAEVQLDNLVADISSSLPRGSAFIEYAIHDYNPRGTGDWTTHYVALVILSSGRFSIIQLGDAPPTDSLIQLEYSRHFLELANQRRPPTSEDAELYRFAARQLYDRLWKPLEEYLGGATTVFIAPEGPMSRIAFAALVDEQGRYLVEQYATHRVDAGRDFLHATHEVSGKAGLLIVGDPAYDRPSFERDSTSLAYSGGITESEDEWLVRRAEIDCGELRTLNLHRLGGARREAQLVSEAWVARRNDPVYSLLDKNATEEQLREQMPGKSVLHIATHGYALKGQCGPGRVARWFESESDYAGENPFLMSGLALSGANNIAAQEETSGAYDGIMTASEFMSVNLSRTDLVVLSGCETGLGVTRMSEGVYGLRRALQVAGAQTVISALWSIPDRETPDLMRDIYASRATDYPTVMREVALKRIAYARDNGLPDHPLVWGAFVAVGDWKKSW